MKRLYFIAFVALLIITSLSLLIRDKLNDNGLNSFENHIKRLNILDSLNNKYILSDLLIENRTLLIMYNSQCQFCNELITQLENHHDYLKDYKVILISFENWEDIQSYKNKFESVCHLNLHFFQGEIPLQKDKLKGLKVPQIYYVLSLDQIKPIKSLKEIFEN